MTKEKLLVEINKMVDEMQVCLTHIKATDGYLRIPADVLEHLPEEMLAEGHRWLKAIYEGRFLKWCRVWRLRTPEMWRRYFTWGGFENHREMVMLREVSHEVRQAVVSRARPDVFKKGKINVILKKAARDAAKARKQEEQSAAADGVDGAGH